jgi:hypothetical protein
MHIPLPLLGNTKLDDTLFSQPLVPDIFTSIDILQYSGLLLIVQTQTPHASNIHKNKFLPYLQPSVFVKMVVERAARSNCIIRLKALQAVEPRDSCRYIVAEQCLPPKNRHVGIIPRLRRTRSAWHSRRFHCNRSLELLGNGVSDFRAPDAEANGDMPDIPKTSF